LQVAAIDAPPLPNFNPANPQLQDGHVPRPKQMTAPTPSSSKDPFRREENETLRTGYELGLQPTDIDGLSLASSSDGNRVVVSFKNNVKLESGVRLTLRVTAQNQKRSAAQAP
jgi:hypothetical protein